MRCTRGRTSWWWTASVESGSAGGVVHRLPDRLERAVLVHRAHGRWPPADHEFPVSDGRVRLVQVHTGRSTEHRRRLYDPGGVPVEDVAHGSVTGAPPSLPGMIEVAEALSADFDLIRVDLFDVDGEVCFGSLTPCTGAGVDRFGPVRDRVLGSRWGLAPSTS